MMACAGTDDLTRMGGKGIRVARAGLSLIELLIAVAILGVVTGGLALALNQAVLSHRLLAGRQDLLSQGNYALRRMFLFARETSEISLPNDDKLEGPERVLDQLDNTTRLALPDGDGILDADSNANGLVDDDKDSDPEERFQYEHVGSQILETLPNYGTAAFNDYLPPSPICDRVEDLKMKKLADDLFEITLVLNDGRNRVELFTRIKARIIVP